MISLVMRGWIPRRVADTEADMAPEDLISVISVISSKAFLAADNQENVTVLSLFDNEEIGSLTRQGADSTFLSDVLERVALCCGKSREELLRAIAGGFLLSADNAHAVHPDLSLIHI